MRKGGGKAKGSEYERQVCKQLSLWVSHGKREDLFWRSAMSGGRATVGKRSGKDLSRHAGDISATHVDGHALTDHWYVECKRYAELRMELALLEGAGPLAGFWKEACEQATVHEKLPMLIVRQDRAIPLVIIPRASALSPYGTHRFPWKCLVMTSNKLLADFFDFDMLMATKFEYTNAETDRKMLEPGELARILGYSKPRIERVRLNQRVRLR